MGHLCLKRLLWGGGGVSGPNCCTKNWSKLSFSKFQFFSHSKNLVWGGGVLWFWFCFLPTPWPCVVTASTFGAEG